PIASAGWSFAAMVPEAEALAYVYTQARRAGGLLGLALLLVLAAGVVLSSWISRPVQRLDAAARRIADGDLDVRIDTRGGDEIASLGRSFDEMAAQLASREQALRQHAMELERRVE